MKKVHNKSYHDKVSKKHHLHDLKRKNKEYTGFELPDNTDSTSFQKERQKRNVKKIETPEDFSLIFNPDESLQFFQDFMYYSTTSDHIKIDMRNTKAMTIEVLLYLISLHKINKSNDIKVSISIKAPKEYELREFMAQSGFSRYFKARIEVQINDYNIFKIQDKESNQKDNISDDQTCKAAIDFALKFYPNAKFTDTRFMDMYVALAEMMLNTDNHAYNEDGELRNWYLFAVKLEKGLSFYFFDNGRGVLKTAKKNIIEKGLVKAPFSYGHESLMRSVLNGEYRSATKKKHRGKGFPEINEFLTSDTVLLPLILTNRIYCAPEQELYKNIKHNFKGTLFVWLLKDEVE